MLFLLIIAILVVSLLFRLITLPFRLLRLFEPWGRNRYGYGYGYNQGFRRHHHHRGIGHWLWIIFLLIVLSHLFGHHHHGFYY